MARRRVGRPAYAVNGDVIERARVVKGLTQEAAADAIGISRMALSRAENGHEVRLETITAIARHYELRVEDLLQQGAA